MIKIDAARENYRQCGVRSAVLFFVLNDFVSVDPMYQFSLDAYVKLFVQSIEKSAEKYQLVSCIEERIEVLNPWHTLAVYRYACRALFEKHKLILSLHITHKVLGSEGKINQEEYSYFLR